MEDEEYTCLNCRRWDDDTGNECNGTKDIKICHEFILGDDESENR